MIVVPYIDAHLDGFVVQKEQSLVNKYMQDPTYMDSIASLSDAHTGIVDGEVQIIAGVMPVHPHISMAWAMVGENCHRHMLATTRAVKAFFDTQKAPRIETAVRRDFKAGQRWASMLGFNNETPEIGMKNYDEEGNTYNLYARYN